MRKWGKGGWGVALTIWELQPPGTLGDCFRWHLGHRTYCGQ